MNSKTDCDKILKDIFQVQASLQKKLGDWNVFCDFANWQFGKQQFPFSPHTILNIFKYMFDDKIFVTKTAPEQSLELFAKSKWQTFHFQESLSKLENYKNVAKMISKECKPYFDFEIPLEYLIDFVSKTKLIQVENKQEI